MRPSIGIRSPGVTMIVSPTDEVVHRHPQFPPVASHQRVGRREVHQRADRVAGAVHASRLEPLREREEEDDRRRLRPLPDGRRADDRDEHQRVDVERERADGRPAATGRVDAARDDRGAGRAGPSPRSPNPSQCSACAGGQGCAGEHEQADAVRLTDREAAWAGCSCSSHARIPVPFTASATSAAVRRAASCVTRRRWLRMSALNAFEARQVAEPPLEQLHFLVAVHPLDAVHRLGVDLADGAGGGGLAGAHRRRTPDATASASSTWRSPCWNSVTMCWSSSA